MGRHLVLTLMAPPAVKVNVTEVVNAPTKSQTSRQIRKEKESFSSAVKEGVKRQQPSSKCNFCGSVHATEDCATFANLSVDERVKKIQQLRLCFHCFESGHISRNCDAKPTCLKCQKRHHSSSWAEAAFYTQHSRQRTGFDAQRRRRSVSRKNRIDGVTSQSRSGFAHPGAASQLRRRRIDREPRQSFARVTKLRGIQNRRIGGRGDSSHRPRKNSQSRERFVD